MEGHEHKWTELEGDTQNLYCACGEVSRPLSSDVEEQEPEVYDNGNYLGHGTAVERRGAARALLAVQLDEWKDAGAGAQSVVQKLLDLLSAIAEAPE